MPSFATLYWCPPAFGFRRRLTRAFILLLLPRSRSLLQHHNTNSQRSAAQHAEHSSGQARFLDAHPLRVFSKLNALVKLAQTKEFDGMPNRKSRQFRSGFRLRPPSAAPQPMWVQRGRQRQAMPSAFYGLCWCLNLRLAAPVNQGVRLS